MEFEGVSGRVNAKELRVLSAGDNQRACMLREHGAQCARDQIGPTEGMRNDARREMRDRSNDDKDAWEPNARESLKTHAAKRDPNPFKGSYPYARSKGLMRA